VQPRCNATLCLGTRGGYVVPHSQLQSLGDGCRVLVRQRKKTTDVDAFVINSFYNNNAPICKGPGPQRWPWIIPYKAYGLAVHVSLALYPSRVVGHV